MFERARRAQRQVGCHAEGRAPCCLGSNTTGTTGNHVFTGALEMQCLLVARARAALHHVVGRDSPCAAPTGPAKGLTAILSARAQRQMPGDGKAHTPVADRSARNQVESPNTPFPLAYTNANVTGASTPEVTTLAPKPCRVYPGSPGCFSTTDDPECSHELQEVLRGEAHGRIMDHGKGMLPASGEAHTGHSRPLSSISTSAGPTPSPEGRTSPHVAPGTGGARRNSASLAKDPTEFPAQVRKVFVGGIPQDMQEEELIQLFSQIAPVKRAWVQRYRDVVRLKSPTSQKHRGFGFVIFQESGAVDRFLGSDVSKFIAARDGRKLEVKRAISSTDMPADGARPEQSSRARGVRAGEYAGKSIPATHAQKCGSSGPQPPPPRAGGGEGEMASAASRQNSGSMTHMMPGMMVSSHPGLVSQASPAALPWPTTTGQRPQAMTPPPQVQIVAPVAGGVPVAAPTACAQGAVVMPVPQHGNVSFVTSNQQAQPLQWRMQMAVSPCPGMPCNDAWWPSCTLLPFAWLPIKTSQQQKGYPYQDRFPVLPRLGCQLQLSLSRMCQLQLSLSRMLGLNGGLRLCKCRCRLLHSRRT